MSRTKRVWISRAKLVGVMALQIGLGTFQVGCTPQGGATTAPIGGTTTPITPPAVAATRTKPAQPAAGKVAQRVTTSGPGATSAAKERPAALTGLADYGPLGAVSLSGTGANTLVPPAPKPRTTWAQTAGRVALAGVKLVTNPFGRGVSWALTGIRKLGGG